MKGTSRVNRFEQRVGAVFFLNRCADVRTRDVRVSLATMVCMKVVLMGLKYKLEKMISERLIKRGENDIAKMLMLLGIGGGENGVTLNG